MAITLDETRWAEDVARPGRGSRASNVRPHWCAACREAHVWCDACGSLSCLESGAGASATPSCRSTRISFNQVCCHHQQSIRERQSQRLCSLFI